MSVHMESPGAYEALTRRQIGVDDEQAQVLALLAIASAINRLANAVEKYAESQD